MGGNPARPSVTPDFLRNLLVPDAPPHREAGAVKLGVAGRPPPLFILGRTRWLADRALATWRASQHRTACTVSLSWGVLRKIHLATSILVMHLKIIKRIVLPTSRFQQKIVKNINLSFPFLSL
jgi:hypothetical protein